MRDYGFTAVQQDELWRLWKEGASLGSIARSLNGEPQHVRRFLSQTGGLRAPTPRRSLRARRGQRDRPPDQSRELRLQGRMC